jgi:HK97 family phage portal protein
MAKQESILQSITETASSLAKGMGTMVKAFNNARQPEPNKRPRFIGDIAKQARWAGGNYNKTQSIQRAMLNSWVYTAIWRKSLDISKAKLYIVDNPEGGDETGYEMDSHPFPRILRKPNPWMGGSYLRIYTHWWLDLAGEAYWFLAPDDDGDLAELWPLPADQVEPMPGDEDHFVKEYTYTANGSVHHIPPFYICHIQYPNPFDPFRGLAPLNAGMLPVDSDLAMARWNGSFFGQDNVMPSAVINLSSGDAKTPIDQADIQAVKADLTENYQATSRRTLVTGAYDMAVQVLGYSARDMDFLAGRDKTREEIFHDLGVPPALFDTRAAEANASVAKQLYIDNTIWPTLGLYAEQMTAEIISRFYTPYQELRFRDIRTVDKTTNLSESTGTADVLMIDERRKKFWNLGPLPNGRGQRLAIEVASVVDVPPAETVVPHEVVASQPPQRFTGTAPVQLTGDTTVPVKNISDDLKRWRIRSIKSLSDGRSLTDEFVSNVIPVELNEAIHEGLEQSLDIDDVKQVFGLALVSPYKGVIRSWRPWSGFEQQLTTAVSDAFSAQMNLLLERLKATGDASVLSHEEMWQHVADMMDSQVGPLLEQLAMQAALRVQKTVSAIGETGIATDWNLTNQAAIDHARQQAGKLVTHVTETTRNAVGEQVASWAETSEGFDGLVRRVRSLGDETGKAIFSGRRAESIAMTEATNTYAGANAAAWATAGYRPAVYKPAAHVNCRCYIQPYTMPDGERVLVWYTARDERVCKQELVTPWGSVSGCAGLHRHVISEGHHMGKLVQ